MDKQKLIALKYFLSQVENLYDRGPEGEGWQSDEYEQGLLALRLVIEELESKFDNYNINDATAARKAAESENSY